MTRRKKPQSSWIKPFCKTCNWFVPENSTKYDLCLREHELTYKLMSNNE